MIALTETIRQHSAIVNEGSGVIVQSMSSDYSYILTAKHVLREVNTLKSWDGKPIHPIDIYIHDDNRYDCAIIKIPFREDLSLTRFRGGNITYKSEAIFFGFPRHKRDPNDNENWIKKYDGWITDSVDQYHVLTIEGLPPRELIEGASGGGVYLVIQGKPFLIGVEFGMDGPQPEEPGVVRLHDLRLFDSIVVSNNLAPILPSFFSCFRKVQSRTFSFNPQIVGSFDRLRQKLHAKISDLVAAGAPSPQDILQKYQNDLIVVGQSDHALLDIDLWVSYAEFLAIDALIHDVDRIDIGYLNSTERVRRLVYSQREETWLRDFSNILQSARNLLDDGGTLVVASKDKLSQPVPDPSLLNDIVSNISVALMDADEEDPRIDVGIPTGKIPFKFVLLGGMHHQCISLDEFNIRNDNPENLIDKFRTKYNGIVKWK